MNDPVITDLAARQAAQHIAELQQLAREHELDMQLADPVAIGTLLLERIGDRDTPESVRECLAKLLGNAVRAAHEGKPLAEVGRDHPVFCGWALEQIYQRAAEFLKEAA